MSTLFGRKRGRPLPQSLNPQSQLRSDGGVSLEEGEKNDDGNQRLAGLRTEEGGRNRADDDVASTTTTKKKKVEQVKQQSPPEPESAPTLPSNSIVSASAASPLSSLSTFADLGLSEPLVATCRSLGFKRPTPVQRSVIPFLLHNTQSHLLALAATGSGKTAAFVLPIVQHLARDPYGIYCVILTPTRELAKQIHQQVLALGGPAYSVKSTLVVGGLDATQQATQLDSAMPHFCVATPGRLALLLRGPHPPRLKHARYLVLDEADRLLAPGSGFERDVAELMLHVSVDEATTAPSGDAAERRRTLNRHSRCQTLLFSATMTRSLDCVEEMAGAGMGRLPLAKIVVQEGYDKVAATSKKQKKTKKESPKEQIKEGEGSDGNDDDDDDSQLSASASTSDDDDDDDDDPVGSRSRATSMPKIPAGLKQEYVFMPSRVRDAYLLATLRALMENGGRQKSTTTNNKKNRAGAQFAKSNTTAFSGVHDDGVSTGPARSAIVFVSTCERAAFVSEMLAQVGVSNVALHSLLSQNRRLASLGKFKSQLVRVLVATDVASRGLDIPTVDLVVNAELPRSAVSYVHRVGRTVRVRSRSIVLILLCEASRQEFLTHRTCLCMLLPVVPRRRPGPEEEVAP
jgi:superfamily II DNA/RNA helicase